MDGSGDFVAAGAFVPAELPLPSLDADASAEAESVVALESCDPDVELNRLLWSKLPLEATEPLASPEDDAVDDVAVDEEDAADASDALPLSADSSEAASDSNSLSSQDALVLVAALASCDSDVESAKLPW
ncbi:hypothetical protein PC112_g16467 [Phytophthora cactorum]|nr:hypothetical protein PC112_g16467 [Phytophthora cactorum]